MFSGDNQTSATYLTWNMPSTPTLATHYFQYYARVNFSSPFTGTLAAPPIVLVPPKSTSPVKYTRSGFLFHGYFSMFQVDAPVDSIIKVRCAVQQSGGITPIVKGTSAA